MQCVTDNINNFNVLFKAAVRLESGKNKLSKSFYISDVNRKPGHRSFSTPGSSAGDGNLGMGIIWDLCRWMKVGVICYQEFWTCCSLSRTLLETPDRTLY